MDKRLLSKQCTNNGVLFQEISLLLETARKRAVHLVNNTMVRTYFEIGRLIVEHEQKGNSRAEYGKSTLKRLSERLIKQFGKGFSKRNLEQMRLFYLTYEKTQTVSAQFELSWSHYLLLMRIRNSDERSFYEREAVNAGWSLRELERQYNSALYQRLLLSHDKDAVRILANKGECIEESKDIVRDPYILEFLGLPEKPSYSESDLEQKLIEKLQSFLLELGKGYAFVGRQVRISFDEQHFFVDLVFYNRMLQCFVLIDLKIGKITHQDIGQMQMYVNYYDRYVKTKNENKTVGIILCRNKNDALVQITLPEDNKQIFASKYETVLPDKRMLEKLISERDCS